MFKWICDSFERWRRVYDRESEVLSCVHGRFLEQFCTECFDERNAALEALPQMIESATKKDPL